MPNKNSKIVFLSVLLIAVLGIIVYANSLHGEFLWDDYHLVKDNTFIRDLSNITKYFTGSIGAGAQRAYHFYRPLQTLTYAIDYVFWKQDVTGYHLTNMLLHILTALSVYWLINVLFKDNLIALFTGLFFVAHPLHTEAVAYIAGRSDSLAAMFMFLCMVFYVKNAERKSASLRIIMALAYIAALLSKESAMFLPMPLLLYHYTFKKKINAIDFGSLLAIAISYIIVRATVLKGMLTDIINNTTIADRMPGFFVAIFNYIKLLLFPFGLHMEYAEKLFFWSDPKAFLGTLLVFLCVGFAFKKKKANNLIFFSILWFFLLLTPYSNIYPINAYMAEHWLYVPSVGFFLLIAYGFRLSYKIERFKYITIALIIGLLSFYSVLAIRQNVSWGNPFLFYNRLLKYVQDSETVYNNLGVLYAQKDDYQKAIEMFKKSIDIKFYYDDPYFNLGKSYKMLGRYKEAIDFYEKGLQYTKNPVKLGTYYDMGEAYTNAGKYPQAISIYKKIIEVNPVDGHAFHNLSVIYLQKGERDLAMQYYNEAAKRGLNDQALLESIRS
ncbi:MAG: tetratricopeptide repeat protein [Candidatus Omnitrophota bacterium]